MGLVRVKESVYLPVYGYKHAGEEFEYDGQDNEHLESIETGPYSSYSDPELRGEISRRGLTYVAVATTKDLQAVLLDHDAKAETAKVEPKPVKPAQGPKGDAPPKKTPKSDTEGDAAEASAEAAKASAEAAKASAELAENATREQEHGL